MTLAVLMGSGYLIRGSLFRAVIAYRAYRLNIFTPPPAGPGQSRINRVISDVQFYWDFAKIPIERKNRLNKIDPVLKPLVTRVTQAQAKGLQMQYSMNIYREVRWRLNFTSDLEATRNDVRELDRSLSSSRMQTLAAQQQPDGSWAMGINIWFLQLYYSVDSESIQNCIPPPRYPLSFLDRINSPKQLSAELNSALYDDFTRTETFNRERLDETFSALARLLLKSSEPACYRFHPELAQTLRSFVDSWQNPETGCWGQWLLDRQGRVWKMDDMGITFHVVSDTKGQVKHLDQIANRLFQLGKINFPTGLRLDGHYENHLNADAVTIFRYAWPTLNSATRKHASQEMEEMLRWCLTNSLERDGSFKISELDDTTTDAEYYGIWFLNEVGYFDKQKRFWTEQEFPDAEATRVRIENRLRAMGLHDSQSKEAFGMLQKVQ